MAGAGGQVVGRDVGGDAAGRSQSDGETARQVEKHLRHEITGIANGIFTLCLGLLYQIVICFLKEILEEDKML